MILFFLRQTVYKQKMGPTTNVTKKEEPVKKRSGVNFTNIFCTSSTPADPKSAKKTNNMTVFFVLLGSAGIKDARKMMVKLTMRDGAITNTRFEARFIRETNKAHRGRKNKSMKQFCKSNLIIKKINYN